MKINKLVNKIINTFSVCPHPKLNPELPSFSFSFITDTFSDRPLQSLHIKIEYLDYLQKIDKIEGKIKKFLDDLKVNGDYEMHNIQSTPRIAVAIKFYTEVQK